MAGLPRSAVSRSMVVLVALRVVYAYNWFDIGPGLPLIASTYHGVPASQWGFLLAAFFAGAAMLQVPAGLLARRHGTRTISLVGAGLLGGSALLCALAPDFPVLLVLRFASGAGAGLFFSPAIALVATLYPPGERGIPVGAFSSAFAAGAGLGTFVPALVDPIIGWQASLAIGGGAMLVLFALGGLVIPRGAGAPATSKAKVSPSPSPRKGLLSLPALRSRGVWAIGFAFVGLEGASLSTSQFFVPYAEGPALGWGPVLAGAVGALFVTPSVFGGPLGGRLVEKFTNRRTQLFIFTALPALLLLLVPRSSVVGIASIATLFAFTFGMVYAMMYVIPPYLPGIDQEDTPLAIGLLNAVQLAGGATVSAVVGWVVATFGFADLWTSMVLFILVPLAFLLLVPVTGRSLSRP